MSQRCQLLIVEKVIIDQILHLSSTPSFCAESSPGTTQISVRWNRIRLHRGVNFLLLVWEYVRKRITSLLTVVLLVSYTQICQGQGWQIRRTVTINTKWIHNLHQSFLLMKGGMRSWQKRKRWTSLMTTQMMNMRGHLRVYHQRRGEVE